ncbi:hypothetical protein [Sphingomonas sp. 7/4-4]|uniref:hypothetical protein n=1 Tax=Sphingomonas sp. 7/4-4 TaxID=3018446 RepID=UPI003FA79D72
MPGIDPVRDQIDRAILLPQRVRDGGPQIGIVLYEQNAHAGRLPLPLKPKLNTRVQRAVGDASVEISPSTREGEDDDLEGQNVAVFAAQ